MHEKPSMPSRLTLVVTASLFFTVGYFWTNFRDSTANPQECLERSASAGGSKVPDSEFGYPSLASGSHNAGTRSTPQRLLDSRPGQVQTEISASTERLSVHVVNRSLPWILENISKQSRVPIILKNKGLDRRVTVNIDSPSLEKGLRSLLQREDVFLLYGGPGDRLRAVLVYAAGGGDHAISNGFAPEVSNLEQQYLSDDPGQRAIAVRNSVEHGDPDARTTVLMSLEDMDEYVRAQALSAAINHGFSLPPEKLINLALYDPSATVRLHALEGIAGVADDSSIDERLRTLSELAQHDPEAYVKETAARLIEEFNSQEDPSTELPAPPDKGHASAEHSENMSGK